MAQSKVALIGLGYWGKNILRVLSELDALAVACDTDPSIIEQRKQDLPKIKYSNDIQQIFQDPNISAVAIATPAVTHFDLVQKALVSGKDVFVEKPLALHCKEGEKLVKLAKAENRILMVGHILQYHPAVLKLKELVKTGELGKVQYIYSNRLNIGKLRVEENILWSFAPHDISTILMLIDEEPIKVHSFGASYLNEDIFDTTLTTLTFKNKIRAHIFVSWLHPFKEQKLVVVGSQAMAVFDDMTNEKLFLYPHKIKWEDGKIPVAHKAERSALSIASGEPLKAELEHFLECVEKRKKPLTDGEEGLRVLNILEKAEISLRKENKYD